MMWVANIIISLEPKIFITGKKKSVRKVEREHFCFNDITSEPVDKRDFVCASPSNFPV